MGGLGELLKESDKAISFASSQGMAKEETPPLGQSLCTYFADFGKVNNIPTRLGDGLGNTLGRSIALYQHVGERAQIAPTSK